MSGPLERDVPPVGEQIHLPGPSLQPLLITAGITLALIGVTVSIWLVIIGCVVTLWVALRWIADTRREMNELPLDHGEH